MESKVLGFVVLSFLKTTAWFFYFLPRRLQVALGSILGDCLCGVGLRKKIAEENILRAFPGDQLEQIEKRAHLLKSFYKNFGQLIFEILLLLGPMPLFVKKYVRTKGKEHWERAAAQGRGVIMLASHVGNWEMMAATTCMNETPGIGVNGMIVTKHLKPEWLHRAIEEGRSRCGVKGTYEPTTMRDILKHLKNKGTIGIVLDQFAGAPVGIRVPFFGVPVGTALVVAMLAKRTGAPVLTVKLHRGAQGLIDYEIGSEVPWIFHENPHRELALNTARYTELIEQDVRQYPEQWLWIHKRFKGDLSPLSLNEWDEPRQRT